jgi:hypothetical protein
MIAMMGPKLRPMKPQRPQRQTLCPQKDPPIKEIRDGQGTYGRSVGDEVINGRKAAGISGLSKRRGLLFFFGNGLKQEIRGHRGRGNTHFFDCLTINLFSVSSVVGF